VLDFRVLGPFEVVVDESVVRLGGPQQRSVLALLALRANEVVSIDAIIDGLWGERVPPSSLGIVRNYVSRLRRALAVTRLARLSSRPPGYVLDTDPDHLDAHCFTQLVRRARHAADVGDPEVASIALEQALGLWRGPVLADLTRLDSLRPTIAHLEEMRLDAVESRVDVDLALGRHAELVGELKALTDQHPLRERLWMQRIVALYRCGRQAEALGACHEARTTLIAEVGVDAGPELQEVERQVRCHADELRWSGPSERPWPPAARSSPAAVAARGPGRIPLQAALTGSSGSHRLVGRTRERTLLRQRLDAMASGQFRAVVVAGPPGIGKSALVRWVAGEAHGEGATILGGWADEGSSTPFQPLDEAIGHWVAHAPTSELRRLAEVDAAHLVRMVPALAERRGAPPPARSPCNDLDRQRLFDAVIGWIGAVAATQPALVVLEDVHWADPASLLAVRHVLRHPPSAGVLLLMTYRDTEPARSDALAALLAGTRGNDDVDRVDLVSLGDEDGFELIGVPAGVTDEAAGRTFAAALNRRTGGNPLFIHETLRHLLRHRAIDPEAGIWTAEPLETYGVPPGLAELLDERVRRLPAAPRAVLQQAAVLGQPFDLPLLSRTASRPEIEVAEALEPALSTVLVVPADASAGAPRFGFSHAVVREAILDGLPLSQRLRTHWQAGQALLAQSGSDPDPHLGEVARHLAAGAQAGDPHVALAACVRAGQQALGTLAFEAAAAQFATAVDLVEPLTDADPDLAYAALLGLGYASAVLNDVDRQRDSFLRAVAVARQHRRPNGLAFLAIGLAIYRMAVGARAPEHEPLAEVVDEAYRTLRPTPSLERCCLLAFMTVRAAMGSRRSQQDDLAERTAEAAAALGTPTAEAMALMARGWTLIGSPDREALRSAGERALSLSFVAEPEVVVPLRHFVVPLLTLPALQAGHRGELDAVRARTSAELERRGDQQITTWWLVLDAALALCRGEFDEVPRLGAQLEATGLAIWQGVSLWQRGLAAIEQRDHAEVVTAIATELAGTISASPTDVGARALLASLYTTAGDRIEATRHLDVVRRHLRLDQLGWDGPFILRHLAEIAAHHDDDGLAADLLPVLTGYSGQMLVTTTGLAVEAAADRATGQVLLTLGRVDEAIGHLATAMALEQSFGADALATRTGYWQARALLARRAPGDITTAGRLLDQAASDAHRLGMAQLRRDIEALA
jgi:DNA-binding SARP family transcriptional activator